MTGGRNRKKRCGKNSGCLRILMLVIGIAAAGAYAVPWAQSRLSGELGKRIGSAVKESVNFVPQQEAEFPEMNITAEEVEGGFYYQQIESEEQKVYRELLQGINAMEEKILLHAGKDDHPEKVYEYLLYDRPELFWCDGSSRMTVYEEYTEFYPGYSCSMGEKERRQQEIERAVSACLSEIDPGYSDYERIKYVYEYIVKTVEYDDEAPDNQNIYSALVGKRSVCAGYSRATQYLLEKLEIEAVYVVGNVEGQGAHAWNIVNCGGKYYQMDVTFGDPVFLSAESGEVLPDNIINYDYLCCTDEEILVDHVQSSEVVYPVCDSDELNYYKMNGIFYDSVDGQILLSAMNDSIYAGKEVFECRFSDMSAYSQAREIMVNELFPKAAENLASVYGLERVQYTYAEDKKHCKIMVFWNYQ